jgi:hypothetical protein
MAEHEIGDLVEYFPFGEPPRVAIVVDKQTSNQGTIRTLAPNPADDVPVGPTGSWSTNQIAVTINDTANPGTATLSASSRLPQDLRDKTDRWQVAGNFDDRFWESSTSGTPGITSHTIECSNSNRDTWIWHATKTEYTVVTVEVKHPLGTTVRAELYEYDGVAVTGPSGSFADVIRPTLGVNSDSDDANWQVITINTSATSYPTPVLGRIYTLRLITGTNQPGALWEARNIDGEAGPILV